MPKFELHAFVSRGKNKGQLLFPHQHEDSGYVVSKTRLKKDYVHLASELEILPWLEKGYGLRMSNANSGIEAPSIISPESIYRPVL